MSDNARKWTVTRTKGQITLKVGRHSFIIFYPAIVKTNVDFGVMVKTGVMYKTYNQWSDTKFKSVAVLVAGLGVGFIRMYEEEGNK